MPAKRKMEKQMEREIELTFQTPLCEIIFKLSSKKKKKCF